MQEHWLKKTASICVSTVSSMTALMISRQLWPACSLRPSAKSFGHAEVRQVIHTPKLIVAGCYVQDGKITSSCRLRLIRDGIVIHEGKIASLRRFKDDVKEVAQGFECGISLESYRDVKEGDQLESFELKEEAATLE